MFLHTPHIEFAQNGWGVYALTLDTCARLLGHADAREVGGP